MKFRLQMPFSAREIWTTIHGLVFGGVFLIVSLVVLVELSSLRRRWVTLAGARERITRLRVGAWVMAVFAWITVITGTYFAFPWFRATPVVDDLGRVAPQVSSPRR